MLHESNPRASDDARHVSKPEFHISTSIQRDMFLVEILDFSNNVMKCKIRNGREDRPEFNKCRGQV